MKSRLLDAVLYPCASGCVTEDFAALASLVGYPRSFKHYHGITQFEIFAVRNSPKPGQRCRKAGAGVSGASPSENPPKPPRFERVSVALVESFAHGVSIVKSAHGFDNAFRGFSFLPQGKSADLTKRNSDLSNPRSSSPRARDSTKASLSGLGGIFGPAASPSSLQTATARETPTGPCTSAGVRLGEPPPRRLPRCQRN